MCVCCYWCIGKFLTVKLGEESTTTKPQQPIPLDDESNQHLVNDDRSDADNAIDVNSSNNNGDNNVVMQDTVAGTVG